MMRVVGWLGLSILGTILTISGIFMLISPRAWFRLPVWIRTQGSLTGRRYASGLGAVQVRIAGAVFLAGIAWVLYAFLTVHR